MIISVLLVASGAASTVWAQRAYRRRPLAQARPAFLQGPVAKAPPRTDRQADLRVDALALSTSAIHVQRALVAGTPLVPLYWLDSLGFLGFLYTLRHPSLQPYRELSRYGLTLLSFATIAAFFIVRGVGGFLMPYGLATKVIEALLIWSLWNARLNP